MEEVAHDDLLLHHSILESSEAAMRFYTQMSGEHPSEASFIRDWCAITLHRDFGRAVAIETNRSKFRASYVTTDEGPAVFDRAGRSKQFKIDLIIRDPAGSDRVTSRLRAIVEFTTDAHQKTIKSNIERTARLLSAIHDADEPEDGSRFGYEVVCVAYASSLYVDQDLDDFLALQGSRDCPYVTKVHSRRFELEVPAGEDKGQWHCAAFGLVLASMAAR